MRQEGCKDDCSWTTVSSGTCAKAVCSPLSQGQWGVKKNYVAVTDLHSCRKYYSQIFRLLKSLKILRMFICQAIKHYKELWMVETGLSHEP